MEKVNNLFLIGCLTLILSSGVAQESPFINTGLISARLTLSPSIKFAGGSSDFYLHGNLEGYISNAISLAGEGYFYLGTLASVQEVFRYNHSLFFGASRHFIKNRQDLYVGLQPGLAFTKLNPHNPPGTTQAGVNPLMSFVSGYNYYVGKIFHYFIQVRCVLGNHNYDSPHSLSELRFSAGLGFNLQSRK